MVDAAIENSCYGRYSNDNKDVPDGNNTQFEKEAHEDDPMLDKCYIVATKNIKVDEEIFVSYGKPYWDPKNQPKMRSFQTVVQPPVSSSSTQPNKKRRKNKYAN